ncbi:type VI secretion system baseplate subunit TssE [Paraburkholderia sp. SIMBA_055]|jgi:type VI secretion system protein
MKERRLLERIASYEVEGERLHMTRYDVLIESILAHLLRILNTRQGSVPIDPQFGVPDFTNLASSFSSGSVQDIVADITRMLRRYEPRLKGPRVEQAEEGRDVLSLSFSIEGLVSVDDHDIPVRLSTRVSSDGRVYLKRS